MYIYIYIYTYKLTDLPVNAIVRQPIPQDRVSKHF